MIVSPSAPGFLIRLTSLWDGHVKILSQHIVADVAELHRSGGEQSPNRKQNTVRFLLPKCQGPIHWPIVGLKLGAAFRLGQLIKRPRWVPASETSRGLIGRAYRADTRQPTFRIIFRCRPAGEAADWPDPRQSSSPGAGAWQTNSPPDLSTWPWARIADFANQHVQTALHLL
jgi:hypothetical protein